MRIYRTLRLLLVASLPLAPGCAQITGQVKLDTAAAQEMASKDASNPVAGAARAQCYGDIANLAVQAQGVLSIVEQAIQGQELVQGPCSQVTAWFVATVLSHVGPLP